jgi:hypothetical protein
MSGALALFALLALAQDGGRAISPNAGIRAGPDAGTRDETDAGVTRLPPQQASAEMAKKSVDAAHIELQSARLYVLGLFLLSKPPTTVWDREHSITLFNQLQEAIGEADRSLAELSGMAKGKWEKADQPLRNARQTIVQVQKDLRSISVPHGPRRDDRRAGSPSASTTRSIRHERNSNRQQRRWTWTRSCAHLDGPLVVALTSRRSDPGCIVGS